MTSPTSPKLGARLAAVREMVQPGARVADIGCDHALLALDLAASGRAAAVIATEVDARALARARRPPPGAAWGERMSYRIGRGLDPLLPSDRIDVVVVAGLGGRSIAALLDDPRLNRLAPGRLVVQPACDAGGLRRFLVVHGWRIVDERLVGDGRRFHPLAAVEPGDGRGDLRHPRLDGDAVLEAGPVLLRSGEATVREYWETQVCRLARITASGRSGPSIDVARRQLERARSILLALEPVRERTT